MSRRKPFTDKEHLARAKNYQEEKVLQLCIKQLEHEQHAVEDSIVQERKALVQAQRMSSRTSGCSVLEDGEDDASIGVNWNPTDASLLHLRKPWAFTFHETSYNVVYNKSFDMPKLLGRGLTVGHAQHGDNYSQVCRRFTTLNGRNYGTIVMRSGTTTVRNHERFSTGATDNKTVTDKAYTNTNWPFPRPLATNEHVTIYSQGERLKSSSSHSLSQPFEHSDNLFTKPSLSSHDASRNNKSNVRPSTTSPASIRYSTTRLSNGASKNSSTVEKKRPHSVEWTNGYSTPSRNHKVSQNQKVSQRRRVDSNCSDVVAIDAVEDSQEHTKHFQHLAQPANTSLMSTWTQTRRTQDNTDDNKADGDDSTDDKTTNYIFFKGRKIRNYVKPHERYKVDPFKMERQAKILRKLAIENPVFLNIPRLDNLNIQLNFPKASRERKLRHLVELNTLRMEERRKPVINSLHLQKLVKEFCQSS